MIFPASANTAYDDQCRDDSVTEEKKEKKRDKERERERKKDRKEERKRERRKERNKAGCTAVRCVPRHICSCPILCCPSFDVVVLDVLIKRQKDRIDCYQSNDI